jgi:hypothetical protein
MQLVRLDQIFGLPLWRNTASRKAISRRPGRLVTMNRLSVPRGPASTQAMTRRSTVQFLAASRKSPWRRTLSPSPSLPQQHRVAGQAEDVAQPVALAPSHRLRPAPGLPPGQAAWLSPRMIFNLGRRARRRPMTARSTSATRPRLGVLPGRWMTATGLPVVV